MWYAAAYSAPASEPVSLVRLKEHLRVEGDDENDLLNTYITAARSYAESYCGTPLVSRNMTVKCDSFADFTNFPVVPLTSVSAITYVDEAGADQTLSTSIYEARTDGLTASIVLKYGQSWPSIRAGSRITVAGAVGYATVPEAIVAALLLLLAHWYQNREAVNVGNIVTELPHTINDLLTNHRAFSF